MKVDKERSLEILNRVYETLELLFDKGTMLDDTPPKEFISLKNIKKKLEINALEQDLSLFKQLFGKLHGLCFIDLKTVFIERGDEPEIKLFTLGHEIAHIILKHPVSNNVFTRINKNPQQLEELRAMKEQSRGEAEEFIDILIGFYFLYQASIYRDLKVESQEYTREANYFAAALLVPHHQLIARFNQDDQTLADHFGVDVEVIRYRKKEVLEEFDAGFSYHPKPTPRQTKITGTLSKEEIDRLLTY